jgi:hypothetical protein
MIAFLIQWEKFSFESPVNFSAVAGGLPEQVRGGTPYLFRMIEHEWKKLQNMSINQENFDQSYLFWKEGKTHPRQLDHI